MYAHTREDAFTVVSFVAAAWSAAAHRRILNGGSATLALVLAVAARNQILIVRATAAWPSSMGRIENVAGLVAVAGFIAPAFSR